MTNEPYEQRMARAICHFGSKEEKEKRRVGERVPYECQEFINNTFSLGSTAKGELGKRVETLIQIILSCEISHVN